MTKSTIDTRVNPNQVDKDSQLYTLINHFMTGGKPLTVLSAIHYYGVYALSQRCGELRRMGFPIIDNWTELENGKRVKQYSM